jgi:hypothetical protein
MPMGGARQLAALALSALHALAAAAPDAACGCAQFAPQAPQAAPDQGGRSAPARAVRDFVLFSHRRIGADLIRKQGPYLDTLSASFPHCADDALKLAWLRQSFAGTSDTRLFAERLAHQVDASRACAAAAQ